MFGDIQVPEHDKTESMWKNLEPAPSDPVFGLIHFYLKDENPQKVLLGVGAYRDDAGKPVVLDTVRKAEKIVQETQVEKEYAFPDGIPSFRQKAIELAYGKDHPAVLADRIASCQTVAGTGALRVGFEVLRRLNPKKETRCYVPNVTWSLHHNIIADAGFQEMEFRYYDPVTKGIDIQGMLEDIEKIDDEQILLLQTSCQNPSGVDPTKEQWHQILEIVKRKRHFVFFDSAYHGFGNDDINEDTWSLKTFSCQYHRCMLAQSFSKNFGLYGERTGTISLVCTTKEEKEVMQTNLKHTVLPYYSNPPINGARIVDKILGDEQLTQEWQEEVKKMGGRLRLLRQQIVDKLKEKGSPHDWSHIIKQVGMFAYTGLVGDMSKDLREKYSIYMPFDGRISVAGVNNQNIDHICEAFHQVSKDKKI